MHLPHTARRLPEGSVVLHLTLDEDDRRAIACVRTPEDETYDGRAADEQECTEHLLGFVSLAHDETEGEV